MKDGHSETLFCEMSAAQLRKCIGKRFRIFGYRRWWPFLLVLAVLLYGAYVLLPAHPAPASTPGPGRPPHSHPLSTQRHSLLRYLKLSKDVIAITEETGSEDECLYPYLPDDDPLLINLTDFKYVINKPAVCPPPPKRLLLLVLVHSAPANRERRDAIRTTWGQPIPDARVLFLLGAVADQHLQSRLVAEDAAYEDLVQGSFLDQYRNLTYKHVMALKWAATFCTTASYVAKVDDDGYVNMPGLLATLSDLSPLGARNLLLCLVRHGVNVERNSSKWTVTKEEYEGDKYPTMCLGVAIIYSPDVVRRLYDSSLSTRYFWIDDAHVTGTLAQRTNTSHSSLAGMLRMYLKSLPDPQKTHLLFSYEFGADRIKTVWRHFAASMMRSASVP